MLNQNLLFGEEGYNLTKSLRFRKSASAYLNRTPASSSSLTTWTWSGWVKRGALSNGGNQQLFGILGGGGSQQHLALWDGGDQLDFYQYNGGYVGRLYTTQVFRDCSAYYHLVFVWDTTNATAGDRIRLYVNGQRVTSFSSTTTVSQNTNGFINSSSYLHSIGQAGTTGNQFFDGYIAETNFIDGQALTASSFGETDAQTGVWKPKKYAGTYGTNGFYLPFSDNTSTTTLGYDKSGNSNNWTTNNISLTAGTTYDSMTDVPTMSALASNYCVVNPLDKGTGISLTGGNLNHSADGSGNWYQSRSTMQIPSTGKWYWEFTYNTGTAAWVSAGIAPDTMALTMGFAPSSYGNVYGMTLNGTLYTNNSSSSYGSSLSSGDVFMVAFDRDNSKIYFGKNGTWFNSSDPATQTSPAASSVSTTANLFPFVGGVNSSGGASNFGQRPFSYTPPTGFVALNTFNLPEPSIKAGNKHFDATTYSGNGTSQTITNASGFAPDFVWIKGRNYADNHTLWNTVVGAQKSLSSDATTAETTRANALTAFASNGFTLGTDTIVNYSAGTYVGWQWKAGGTGSSNTAGSITSTVSANPTAGFSVVGWTGTGSVGTLGHGLGVAPKMIIGKRRDGVSNWFVYHESLGNTKGMNLNTTDAASTNSGWWNNTSPTSSVFTMGSYETNNGSPFIAYCFAEVAGYSKFGSYTGNGSSDGTFVHLGFRPKFVMIKRVDAGDTTYWFMFDTTRATYNIVPVELYANSSSAEGSDNKIDILSNGIKIRSTSSTVNSSSINYIYMAFAENPFKYSLAR